MTYPPFPRVHIDSLRHLIALCWGGGRLGPLSDAELTILYRCARGEVARARRSYHVRKFPKRSGGIRLVCEPEHWLKDLQRWILDEVLNHCPQSAHSFAYRKRHSISHCASVHVGARWMVKLDLEGFFNTIEEPRVYRLFESLGYSPLVSFELARLCTFADTRRQQWTEEEPPKEGRAFPYPVLVDQEGTRLIGVLPQGAPTSGAIANLVARDLDDRLAALAHSHGARYTRYSDDLTLSWDADGVRSLEAASRGAGSERTIESSALAARATRESISQFITLARNEISASGFHLNTTKTRVVPPGARKIVLGLLVSDDRIGLTPEFKRDLRYHLHGIERFGLAAHVSQLVNHPPPLSYLNRMQGMVAFATGIDRHFGKQMDVRLTRACRDVVVPSGSLPPTGWRVYSR